MKKIDTRCLSCDHEFMTGELVLLKIGWCCPNCESPNIEEILVKTHTNEPYVPKKGLPFKYNEVKSSTPYDGQEDGN